MRIVRLCGAVFALILFLLGTLASESVFARGGGRGGGSHNAGFYGGGHRAGAFHGGTQFHPGFHHGAKHFHHGFHHGSKHFHPGHGRIGVFVGAPVVLGSLAYTWPYYPPSAYYYPSPYYPPTYIEQKVPQQPAYWYYCPDAEAYYPYVKECPDGWQQVAPQPPS